MLNFDSRWNSTARLPFRILALFLSMLALFMGTLALIDTFSSCPVEYDASFKHGIGGLSTGIIFLIIAVRGRLFKKENLDIGKFLKKFGIDF